LSGELHLSRKIPNAADQFGAIYLRNRARRWKSGIKRGHRAGGQPSSAAVAFWETAVPPEATLMSERKRTTLVLNTPTRQNAFL
jgi:hypothetical protein